MAEKKGRSGSGKPDEKKKGLSLSKKFKDLLKDESAFFEKNKLITATSLIAAASSVAMVSARASAPSVGWSGGEVSADHGSHGVHGSHGSHGTHATHGSHGTHATHSTHSTHATHATHGTHSTHATHASHGTHSTHASHSTHSTHANHSSHGNCPFLSIQDGPDFVVENNIIPESERENLLPPELVGPSERGVVDDTYIIENVPESPGDTITLKVAEFEKEHSYFQDFKLFRAGGGDIGISGGEVVSYRFLDGALESATSGGKDFAGALSGRDGKFDGFLDDVMHVRFRVPEGVDRSKLRLIFRACLRAYKENDDAIALKQRAGEIIRRGMALGSIGAALTDPGFAKTSKLCILVKVSSPGGEVIHVIHPRENDSFSELVDVSGFAGDSDELELDLEFTCHHRLKFVSLVEEGEPVELTELELTSIEHSEKDYDLKSLSSGSVELVPGEHLLLKFRNAGGGDNLVMKARGRYVTE